jgi:elongation factor 1 alpha-like protein
VSRSQDYTLADTCTSSGIPMGFWDDMRWLNVPADRQTIFLEPLYPRGGLLGGSPDAAPKMSKLQALAAARKKKAQEQKNSTGPEDVDKPMADLSISQAIEDLATQPVQRPTASTAKESPRTYPVRKRKNSDPHQKTSQPAQPEVPTSVEPVQLHIPLPSIEQAKPSAFASIMFGSTEPNQSRHSTSSLFTLPYLANTSMNSTDAFAGPSPDDIVLAAQSKGSTHSANPQK